jgi:hypothetical protein
MNFDKAGSRGCCEAAEHLTVLKTKPIGTATVQASSHDSETQYARSYAEELREGAELVTAGREGAPLIGPRPDGFLAPGCSDSGAADGIPVGLRDADFLPATSAKLRSLS